jgi:hypothetical protein
MRSMLDLAKLQEFMVEVGKAARSPGKVYLVGGSTALLLGIRSQTIDIDIKLDPEPMGIFESISILKERLSVNVELASPDQFIPAIPGWRERSEFISRSGSVDFFHYDFYGQALAKIQRGYVTDIGDAIALVRLGKVDPARLARYYEDIRSDIVRFPAIDVAEFDRRVAEFVRENGS